MDDSVKITPIQQTTKSHRTIAAMVILLDRVGVPNDRQHRRDQRVQRPIG
jgi:hypothetical protein